MLHFLSQRRWSPIIGLRGNGRWPGWRITPPSYWFTFSLYPQISQIVWLHDFSLLYSIMICLVNKRWAQIRTRHDVPKPRGCGCVDQMMRRSSTTPRLRVVWARDFDGKKLAWTRPFGKFQKPEGSWQRKEIETLSPQAYMSYIVTIGHVTQNPFLASIIYFKHWWHMWPTNTISRYKMTSSCHSGNKTFR